MNNKNDDIIKDKSAFDTFFEIQEKTISLHERAKHKMVDYYMRHIDDFYSFGIKLVEDKYIWKKYYIQPNKSGTYCLFKKQLPFLLSRTLLSYNTNLEYVLSELLLIIKRDTDGFIKRVPYGAYEEDITL